MSLLSKGLISKKLSKINVLPGFHLFSPAGNVAPEAENVANYLAAQRLALAAAREVASYIQPGWTEKQAASLVDTYLRDHGVRSFFHRAFAWYGDRTRFEGVKSYRDFLPTTRALRENEVFILDVAPIYQGYICDIGYTSVLGEYPGFAKAMAFLKELKDEIPHLFRGSLTGSAIWDHVAERISDAGYDNIHALYPFSVLGHRVHRAPSDGGRIGVLNFGWQSYWAFLSRGVYGQLLGRDFTGDLTGLWAIEPHIGGHGFGAKFEEILEVKEGVARWIETPRELMPVVTPDPDL